MKNWQHLSIILCMMALLGAYATDQNQIGKENLMKNHVVIDKPSMIVIGIECRTSNHPDAGPHDIPKLWGKFYQDNILSQIPNKASDEIIALYCDYEGNYTQPYTCVIGCPVTSFDEVPEGMVAKIIPATSYAVFRAVGEYPHSLIETWGKIWQGDVEQTRTYTGDFEVYGDKFTSGSPKEVEVYIAISYGIH
jgi:predicted transcriptional regulator YdeE